MSTPEQITVSLEWAERLAVVGFPQDDTYFVWGRSSEYGHPMRVFKRWSNLYTVAAAPTASEILGRLPWKIKAEENHFWVRYETLDHQETQCFGDTQSLANAAAAMYCYLAEQKLLPPTA